MEKMVEVERATQEELRQDLKSLFQGAIRVTLEMVLEEELKAMVGARRFERVGSRKDHRNGTYLRRLLTSLGQIDVMVPRSREGGSPADVMGRYRRRSEEVDEMMVEAYVSGVSQRKMGDVTEALLGERVGRSTVSRVAKRLDGAVEALRSAPIEGPHPYLYLDATFLDARWARKVENVSALVAYAVDPDGHRRLLAITLGPEESEDSWSELLEQLLERGLSGVELVIADEHAGLAAAVRRFLPEVRRQRCTVHLQRNVLAKVPHRLRKRVAREVAAVFRAPGLAKAKKRLAEITARWHNELPEAMRVLERGFTAATQFYAFPEPHWARLRTTNSLERLHTEIKRRIRSAGAFPDRASALRLITAVALRTTAVWSERRLPGPLTPRAQGGRQGSLTEASRSFLSLLHTTRDLTEHRVTSAVVPVLAGLLGVLACSDPFQVSDSLGEWGGEGVAAVIETGSATFEFDCAHASVPGGITFDEDGSFEVSGIWVSEGGPEPIEPREELEAVFRGRVGGTSMDLEVDIIPRDATAGPYELKRGRTPVLRKCL